MADGYFSSYIIKVQDANTPFRLIDQDITDVDVVIHAKSTNTGIIRICGNVGVVVGGFRLNADESIGFKAKNAELIYCAGSVVGDEADVIVSGQNTSRLDSDNLRELKALLGNILTELQVANRGKRVK